MEKSKILICDDELGVRESLKLILERDYETILVSDGDEALEALKADKTIKAVLLDIKMPKTDGLEILKQLKQINRALAVIMVTGYQTTEMAAEAIKYGAVDYIIKPINSGAVLSAVHKALHK